MNAKSPCGPKPPVASFPGESPLDPELSLLCNRSSKAAGLIGSRRKFKLTHDRKGDVPETQM